MKNRWTALLALLVLAAVPLVVWFHRVHWDQPAYHQLFINGDLFRYFYPSGVFLHEEIRRGNLPIWNPYQYAGQPFLALHVPGALYPPNLILFGLLSPEVALAVHSVLHTIAAAVLTWLFAGRLGLSPAARLGAALSYALSGPFRLGIYMVAFLSNAAWLPGIFWCLHGVLTTGRFRWGIGLATFSSLAFLTGHAQGFVYQAQLAALYGLFGLVWVSSWGFRFRAIGTAALAALLTLLFCAPQLLPTLELTREAVRGFEGVSYVQASRSAGHPSTVLWGALGALAPAGWPGPLTKLPALTIPLILGGFLARRQRASWVFFSLTAVAVGALLLGPWTPVFRFYYELPLGNLFRVPSRMAFLYTFLTSILIAIGIDGVRQWLQAKRPGAKIDVFAATAIVLLIAAELYFRTTLTLAHPILSPPEGAPRELIEFLSGEPGGSRVFFEKTKYLPRRTLLYKAGMMHGLFVLPDYEPSMPRAYEEYFGVPRHPPWHGRLTALGARRLPRPEGMERLLDLMSVRHYAVMRPAPAVVEQLRSATGGRVISVGPVDLVERPGAVPRVYTVTRLRTVDDRDSALARLHDDDFDPRTEAVVVDDTGELATIFSAGAAGAPLERSDEASITAYSAETVEVTASCASDCLCVLTDLHYPGWRVTVDGAQRKIQRVNFLFRGVHLSPGRHRIVYRYEPLSYRAGICLLSMGLFLAFSFLVFDLGRARGGARGGAR